MRFTGALLTAFLVLSAYANESSLSPFEQRLKNARRWYRSACPSTSPSEARANTAVKVIAETESALTDLKTRSQELNAFLSNPSPSIEQQIETRLREKRERVAEEKDRLFAEQNLRVPKQATAEEKERRVQAQQQRVANAQTELKKAETILRSKKRKDQHIQKRIYDETRKLEMITKISDEFQRLQSEAQACYAIASNTGQLAEPFISDPYGEPSTGLETEARGNSGSAPNAAGSTQATPDTALGIPSPLGISQTPNAPGSSPTPNTQPLVPRKPEDFQTQF